MVAVVVAALLLGGDPRPRQSLEWWGLGAGVLASLAVVGFMLARQQGLLSVAAVLTSLYPAFTVLLATLSARRAAAPRAVRRARPLRGQRGLRRRGG